MWRKLLFFCTLYFVQGAALAYVINFQKPYLAAQGISKEAIGFFTSLLLIPFIIKVGLGYLSDRFPLGRFGSRKPYMILGLTLFAICFGSLSLFQPSDNFMVFAALTWLAAFGLAWFDTCADGWAVDTSTDQEQSAVQAAMIAGKSLGLITMSAAFGWLANDSGFRIVFLIVAGLAVAVLLIVLFAKHTPKKSGRDQVINGWDGLLQPFYVFFALYAVGYAMASFGTDGLLTLHLSEVHKANSLEVGYFGMWRGLGALVGAVAFAGFRPLLGLRKQIYLALVLLGVGCGIPVMDLAPLPSAVLWGITWGFQETAFVTLAMRFAQGRWAATLFAGSMIFANLGNSLGEALGAPLVPRLGFNSVFLMFVVLAWLTIALVPKMLKPIKD